MSQNAVDLLTNRLGTSHPSVLKADFLKAWVRAHGGTAAILASLGVSSSVDSGVGQHQFNLTNAMGSVNYSVTLTSHVASPVAAPSAAPISATRMDSFTHSSTLTGVDTNANHLKAAGVLA